MPAVDLDIWHRVKVVQNVLVADMKWQVLKKNSFSGSTSGYNRIFTVDGDLPVPY